MAPAEPESSTSRLLENSSSGEEGWELADVGPEGGWEERI
jgi:hypothetical protein